MLTIPSIIFILIPTLYLYNITFSLVSVITIISANYLSRSPLVKFLSQIFIMFTYFLLIFMFLLQYPYLFINVSMFLVCYIINIFNTYAPAQSANLWRKIVNNIITPIKSKSSVFINLVLNVISQFDNEITDMLCNKVLEKLLKYKDNTNNNIYGYMDTKKEVIFSMNEDDDLDLPVNLNNTNVTESKNSINNKIKLKDKLKEKKNQRLGRNTQSFNPNVSMPTNLNISEMLKIPGIKNMVSDFVNNQDFEKMVKESLKENLKNNQQNDS